MEFFIPGLFLFLISVAVSFIIVPRFTPLIVAVISILFLTYGVYNHYKIFSSEYRLSTWQDSLRVYAPAVMIGAIILFIIYSILAFFTKGSVPVPPIPNITIPNENTITNTTVQSLNKIANALTNVKTNIIDTVNNTINNANKNRTNVLGNTINRNNKNTVSKSFIETI